MIADPSYTIVKVTPDAVFLIDNDEPARPSVTNCAEEVVDRVLDLHGNDKRIFYRDTMGRWDELAHNGQRFLGFKAGCEGFDPPEVK